MTRNINYNIEKLLVTAALMVVSPMLFCGTANAQDQSEVKYDLLFISHGPDGEQVHVKKRTDGNKRKTVYKDKSANDAIDWAIKRGRITAILKGEYRLPREISITRDEATLIAAPDAKLTARTQKEGRQLSGVIQVVKADKHYRYDLSSDLALDPVEVRLAE